MRGSESLGLISTLLFQPQNPPLLRGRRLSGSWRGSALSRFPVGFRSVFGRLLVGLSHFDRN